jgi:hypothetical protein
MVFAHYYNSPMFHSISKTLRHVRKNKEDVLYVAYVSPISTKSPIESCDANAANEHTLMRYQCTLNDFLQATMHVSSVRELVWPAEIQIVGENWWLSWDYADGWSYNEYPSRRFPYKKPIQMDLL